MAEEKSKTAELKEQIMMKAGRRKITFKRRYCQG